MDPRNTDTTLLEALGAFLHADQKHDNETHSAFDANEDLVWITPNELDSFDRAHDIGEQPLDPTQPPRQTRSASDTDEDLTGISPDTLDGFDWSYDVEEDPLDSVQQPLQTHSASDTDEDVVGISANALDGFDCFSDVGEQPLDPTQQHLQCRSASDTDEDLIGISPNALNGFDCSSDIGEQLLDPVQQPRGSPKPPKVSYPTFVTRWWTKNSSDGYKARARAVIACVECHKRKVRCNAAVHGIPCDNCRHEERSCALRSDRPLPKAAMRKLHRQRRIAAKIVALPLYIKPWPVAISQAEMELLDSRGIAKLPPISVQRNLLLIYCRFVHWQVPALDVRKVLHTLSQQLENPNPSLPPFQKLSLLLLYAIMFVATKHSPLSVIRAAGYDTRQQASQDFYNKAKLLYTLSCEPDQLTVAQSALLLAYGADPLSQTDKGARFWILVALNFCYHQKMLKYSGATSENSFAPNRQECKRLWWSCFVLDHVLAMKDDQVPCIRTSEWDVPMIDIDDFEVPGLLNREYYWPMRALAMTFLEKCQLCMQVSLKFI